ncbi:MAG: hypothetical protein Q9165_007446 [Trypethelium subeluteriae]
MGTRSKRRAYHFAPTYEEHLKRVTRLNAQTIAAWGADTSSSFATTTTQHPPQLSSHMPFFHYTYPSHPARPLTNPIHPIFARQHFPGWDYTLISPVLRLASRLLTSQPLLPFWHAIFYGDEALLPALSHELGGEIGVYARKWTVLSWRSEQKTWEALDGLAEIVRFFPRFPRCSRSAKGVGEAGENCFDDCLGLCCTGWMDEGKLWKMRGNDFHGQGSFIHMHPRIVQDLWACRAQVPGLWRLEEGDVREAEEDDEWRYYVEEELAVPSVQATIFQWATTLVHELAHAAQAIVLCPGSPYEYFFEDNSVAETGHDWELWAFGGTPNLEEDKMRLDDGQMRPVRYMSLIRWPQLRLKNPSIRFAPCRAKDIPDSTRDGYTFSWRISQKFVERLFTDHFWDQDMLIEGRQALWPKQEVGMTFGSTDWNLDREAVAQEFDDCLVDCLGQITRCPRDIEPDGFGRLLRMPLLDDL